MNEPAPSHALIVPRNTGSGSGVHMEHPCIITWRVWINSSFDGCVAGSKEVAKLDVGMPAQGTSQGANNRNGMVRQLREQCYKLV